MKRFLGFSQHTHILLPAFFLTCWAAVLSWAHPTDYDLGWHLRYVAEVLNGYPVLPTNTWTNEMPGYAWFNSSWAGDLIRYAFYALGGFYGIAFLGSLCVALNIYLLVSNRQSSLWANIMIASAFLYAQETIIQNSFRGQWFSLIFLTALLILLPKISKGSRRELMYVFLFFVIWSNLHAGVSLGIAAVVLWYGSEIANEIFHNISQVPTVISRMVDRAKIVCTSFLASLFTPWGLRIYQENALHFDNEFTKTIEEFVPPAVGSTLWWLIIIAALLCISASYVYIRRHLFSRYVSHIIVLFFVFVLCFTARRYFFLLVPIVLLYVRDALDSIRPKQFILRALTAAVVLISITGLIIPKRSASWAYGAMNWDTYCVVVRCSPGALAYLESNLGERKLYSPYQWGGWIIYASDTVKPSIDGRMSQWVDSSGYSAYKTYISVLFGQSSIDTSAFDVALVPVNSPLALRLIELARQKRWAISYRDNNAYVFERR